MSADAKVWYDDARQEWCGLSDWEDAVPSVRSRDLIDVLQHLDAARRRVTPYRITWHPRVYPDGQVGLRGFDS